MNVAEWILVSILSIALFVFLVVGIILIIKLIDLANDVKKVIATGQSVADKAENIASRAATFTTVKGAANTFSSVASIVKSVVAKRNKD